MARPFRRLPVGRLYRQPMASLFVTLTEGTATVLSICCVAEIWIKCVQALPAPAFPCCHLPTCPNMAAGDAAGDGGVEARLGQAEQSLEWLTNRSYRMEDRVD